MWTRQHRQRKTGRFVVPAITAAFLSYFGYHSFNGDFGLEATARFEAQRIQRAAELEDLSSRRKALEKQVELMSDGSLERDMIDEMARYQLNLSRQDDIVIFNTYMN